MRVTLTIDGDVPSDQLARMFASFTTPPTVVVPASAPEPSPVPPAPVAPPTPVTAVTLSREPAVPLSPDTQQKLQALQEAQAEGPPPPRRGRPKGSKNRPKPGAEDVAPESDTSADDTEWAPPVPRPAGGLYGKQVAPPDDPEWEARRTAVRRRLQYVMMAFTMAQVDYKAFLDHLLARYGDGTMLSCVPQGNYEALLAEAEAGNEQLKLTPEMLAAAKAEFEKQKAQLP